MKVIFSAACLLFVSALPLAPAYSAAGTDPAFPPQPAMFLLEDHDSKIYIFGSAHKVKSGTPWRTSLFNTAMGEAQEIWLEATSEEMGNPILRILVNRTGYDLQRKLSDRLTPEEYDELERTAESIGVSMGEINHLRPWAASMRLRGTSTEKDLRSGKQKRVTLHPGVEETIEASYTGKPVRSIENVKEHMLLFSMLSPDEEKELLMSTARDVSAAMDDNTLKTMKLWAAGDLDALDEQYNRPMREKTPGLYDVMMPKRNKIMANAIIRELGKSGTDFFVFGAGHLAGPQNVLSLLQEQGYKAQRIYDSQAPLPANSERKPEAPHYRLSYTMPPYLNVALLPDNSDRKNVVILRMSHPITLQGCFEVSPIDHMIWESDQALDIHTRGYIVNIHPNPERSGCGAAGKPVMVDIPLNIQDLKDQNIQTLNLQMSGQMDIYKLSFAGDTVSIWAAKPTNYYRPDPSGRLTVKLTDPALEAPARK